MIKTILTYPNENLKKKSKIIEEGESVISLVQNMIDTMYVNNGVGLAAPQINIHKCVIVCNPTPINKEETIVLINPIIISTRDKKKSQEGCLSVPGYNNSVIRHRRITVDYIDHLTDEPKTLTTSGMLSCIIQHEIDHLNGVLFIDRIKEKDRNLFNKLYKSKAILGEKRYN